LGEFRQAKVTQFAPETGRLYTTKSQTWVGLYKVIHHTVPGLQRKAARKDQSAIRHFGCVFQMSAIN
jgi:hypothetical protein